jgi:hypothetical protein
MTGYIQNFLEYGKENKGDTFLYIVQQARFSCEVEFAYTFGSSLRLVSEFEIAVVYLGV